MKIGIVPLTWGQFRVQEPDAWPQERVLREVKEAGFDAVASFPGEGQSAAQHLEYLAEFGLVPTPSYFSGEYWIAEKQDEIVESARRKARISREMGLSELFVAAGGWAYVSRANGKERHQLSGHVGPGDGLSDEEWAQLGKTLNAVGAATKDEGVLTCIHNHVATVIETRQECDRLAEVTDPDLVFWGADTGHLAYGGADVVDFTRAHAPRIRALHLKDVNGAVRRQAVEEELDYRAASERGIWTELGQGCIDYPAFFNILRESGYEGWVLSEIDRTQKPSALQSARECREFLRSQGL